jgi:hypothetical protein
MDLNLMKSCFLRAGGENHFVMNCLTSELTAGLSGAEARLVFLMFKDKRAEGREKLRLNRKEAAAFLREYLLVKKKIPEHLVDQEIQRTRRILNVQDEELHWNDICKVDEKTVPCHAVSVNTHDKPPNTLLRAIKTIARSENDDKFTAMRIHLSIAQEYGITELTPLLLVYPKTKSAIAVLPYIIANDEKKDENVSVFHLCKPLMLLLDVCSGKRLFFMPTTIQALTQLMPQLPIFPFCTAAASTHTPERSIYHMRARRLRQLSLDDEDLQFLLDLHHAHHPAAGFLLPDHGMIKFIWRDWLETLEANKTKITISWFNVGVGSNAPLYDFLSTQFYDFSAYRAVCSGFSSGRRKGSIRNAMVSHALKNSGRKTVLSSLPETAAQGRVLPPRLIVNARSSTTNTSNPAFPSLKMQSGLPITLKNLALRCTATVYQGEAEDGVPSTPGCVSDYKNYCESYKLVRCVFSVLSLPRVPHIVLLILTTT